MAPLASVSDRALRYNPMSPMIAMNAPPENNRNPAVTDARIPSLGRDTGAPSASDVGSMTASRSIDARPAAVGASVHPL